MAISAYSKTTYVNGTTPAINATNLNNIEQQVADITSAATADGASPTKIWTSTNDGNAGQPPAPKPTTSSIVGLWTRRGATMDAGGTWAYIGFNDSNAMVEVGILAGGASAGSGTTSTIAWRVS